MGERGDDGEQLAEDLRAFGMAPDEIAKLKAKHQGDERANVIEIEPENRDAFRVFLRAMSQWRGQAIVAGKHLLLLRSGLEYAILPTIAGALGIALDEELLDAIRVMEAEALVVHTRRQEASLSRR